MDRHYESSTHSNSGAALHPADFVRLLRTHIRWWAMPAVVFAVLAGCLQPGAHRVNGVRRRLLSFGRKPRAYRKSGWASSPICRK